MRLGDGRGGLPQYGTNCSNFFKIDTGHGANPFHFGTVAASLSRN
jgi:hypothetical protein